jgi:hypothetical protein
MSSVAEVVTVYAPGQYRDDHNALRFYAAFESWLSEHRTTMRGPGGEGQSPTLATFLETGRSTDRMSTSLHRGPNVTGEAAAPSHESRRGCSAAGWNRPKRRTKDVVEGVNSALAT